MLGVWCVCEFRMVMAFGKKLFLSPFEVIFFFMHFLKWYWKIGPHDKFASVNRLSVLWSYLSRLKQQMLPDAF